MPPREHGRTRTTILIVAAALCGALAVVPVHGIENAECLTCHSDADLTKTAANGKAVPLFVDETKFGASIHGALQCTGCHADINEVPHAESLKPVSCSQCHRIETEIYLNSDHGLAIHKGVTEAASCRTCHGEPHQLLNYRNPQSPVHRSNVPDTCGKCHANTAEMEKYNLRQRAVVVTYDKSVHGIAHAAGVTESAVCTDCHGSHDLHRASNPESKLFWQSIPATCGKCHDNVRQTFTRSIHGQAVKAGLRDAPTCTDCHGEHTIQAVKEATSKVSPSHIPETCGQCHGTERIATRYQLSSTVVDTYMRSYHGLTMQFGGLAVANCASCHGFHDILPSTDPRSSVAKANLPQTCGKCHPAIGTRLATTEFRMHSPPGAAEGKPWAVNLVARVYIVLIVLTIGGMLLHNLIDYLRKARAHVKWARTQSGELRLTKWMRRQHGAMIILFVVLAYSGFVHKFPDAFWSWPFRVLSEGGWWRGMIHRVSGWLFIGLFVAHLIALVGTQRGRAELGLLWLRLHDLKDMIALVLYNLGIRSTLPPHRRWNYIEKSEYWALLWGSAVMIVTGLMLIFTETMLRLWPKVWHDVAQVIHYYEAVLATLAIVVWHFYWVVFDPGEYPVNPAFIIGKKAPHPVEPVTSYPPEEGPALAEPDPSEGSIPEEEEVESDATP